MDKILVAVMTLAFAVGTASSAFAGSLSIPRVPPNSLYQVAADVQMKVWSNGSVNLRAKPSTKSKILAKLKPGTPITVTDKVSGGLWAHVTVNGMKGYIDSRLIE